MMSFDENFVFSVSDTFLQFPETTFPSRSKDFTFLEELHRRAHVHGAHCSGPHHEVKSSGPMTKDLGDWFGCRACLP